MVCGSARSGIWVLKGNARARMPPANLDHLSVQRRQRGTYETAWVTPGHDCLCSCAYGHGAAVRPKTNGSISDGAMSLWSRVAPLLSPWRAKGEVPTGVNPNRNASLESHIPWHCDNEPSSAPQNLAKRVVCTSSGCSVEFQVRRRVPGEVPSIRLDHGDHLGMDGLAQSEYEHRTGSRVNLKKLRTCCRPFFLRKSQNAFQIPFYY